MRAEQGGAAPAPPCVHTRHFDAALRGLRPSVSARDARMYTKLRDRLQAARGGGSGVIISPPKSKPAPLFGGAPGAGLGADPSG